MIIFDHPVQIRVVVESIERHLQNRWELFEPDELPGILLAELLSVILVVSIEILSLDILLYAILDSFVAFDRELQGVENFVSAGLKLNLGALNHALGDALEQVLVSALEVCVLHLPLQLVREYAVELINILLLVPLVVTPPEGLK